MLQLSLLDVTDEVSFQSCTADVTGVHTQEVYSCLKTMMFDAILTELVRMSAYCIEWLAANNWQSESISDVLTVASSEEWNLTVYHFNFF